MTLVNLSTPLDTFQRSKNFKGVNWRNHDYPDRELDFIVIDVLRLHILVSNQVLKSGRFSVYFGFNRMCVILFQKQTLSEDRQSSLRELDLRLIFEGF